ncbi:TPA: hypothetical protein QH450_003647 [Providencia alcalifaciens]|nr:hypothetical protein [Providencia alcalifaciens]
MFLVEPLLKKIHKWLKRLDLATDDYDGILPVKPPYVIIALMHFMAEPVLNRNSIPQMALMRMAVSVSIGVFITKP